jgi:hypothetical protein
MRQRGQVRAFKIARSGHGCAHQAVGRHLRVDALHVPGQHGEQICAAGVIPAPGGDVMLAYHPPPGVPQRIFAALSTP